MWDDRFAHTHMRVREKIQWADYVHNSSAYRKWYPSVTEGDGEGYPLD